MLNIFQSCINSKMFYCVPIYEIQNAVNNKQPK